MNEAASVDSERQSKQRKYCNTKTPNVNELQTKMQISQENQAAADASLTIQEQSAEVVKLKTRKTPAAISPRESEHYETVRLLREEIAEMRKNMTRSQSAHQARKKKLKWDENDVGCIPSLWLKIRLSNTAPVRRTYTSVPKPLLKEAKEYLEDLLNRSWIQKSWSPYSSPIVCVSKKDGSLCLCMDDRELNQKSIPDHHPIPA